MSEGSEPSDRQGMQGRPAVEVGTLGMVLFLAALAILFAATLFAYIAMRTQVINADRQPYPPLGELTLPVGLWASTLVILISSVSLQYALTAIRSGRVAACRRAMFTTVALTVLFLAIQGPCLYQLLARHSDAIKHDIYTYAMMGMLIIVHAAHVIGGGVPMVVIWRRAVQGRYSADSYGPVKYMTMYWHFVDVVWVIMFNVMLLLG